MTTFVSIEFSNGLEFSMWEMRQTKKQTSTFVMLFFSFFLQRLYCLINKIHLEMSIIISSMRRHPLLSIRKHSNRMLKMHCILEVIVISSGHCAICNLQIHWIKNGKRKQKTNFIRKVRKYAKCEMLTKHHQKFKQLLFSIAAVFFFIYYLPYVCAAAVCKCLFHFLCFSQSLLFSFAFSFC